MRIGPYELINQLGSGGMCDVWRARTKSGDELAVKVMRPETPADLFQQEIQALARLNHPSIVQILRWGFVDAKDAEDSSVALGTPWFAMRIAEHGSFNPGSITTWDQFLWFATAMLRALGHSHARSFIHRDIKPENILVEGDLARPHYVLSDFGISIPDRNRGIDSREVRYAAAGTPGYIAPEQLVGRWRDFGPYTDLFSLGVVFYQIIYGTLPFLAKNVVMLGIAQTKGANFLLKPRFDAPASVGIWLSRMLAYNPRERFSLAPDALHALLSLDAPLDAKSAPAAQVESFQNTTLSLPIMTTQAMASQKGQSQQAFVATVHLGDGQTHFEKWIDFPLHSEPIGLELFGLRRAHMVGRKTERDLCWEVLQRCIHTKTATVLALSGADGAGSTMLGRWICEHSLELGVAMQIQVRSEGGPSAITDTLVRLLGLFGLNAKRTHERLSELFEGTDVDSKWVARLALGEAITLSEQAQIILQVLTAFGMGRPIVVLMDNAHKSLEMIELAHALIGAPIPVLLVLTVRSDDPEPMPHEADRLDALLQMPDAQVQHLSPLPDSEIGAFVDTIVSLTAPVRSRVLELAKGNPLHALHLLEIWHVSDDLDGLDSDHLELWNRRFDHYFGPQDRRAVEVAAVLGEFIQYDPWHRVCAACNIPLDHDLVDRLVAARIWSHDKGLLVFQHGSTRDSVLRSATPAQLKRIHTAAAAMYSDSNSRFAFGRHLLMAGADDEALQLLYEVACDFLMRLRISEAKSLAAWCTDRLANVKDDSEAQLFLRLIRAKIALHEGVDGVLDDLEFIRGAAEHSGHETILAEAIRLKTLGQISGR